MDSLDLIFGTVFGQFGQNFRACFQTVRTEFLGLFSDSPDKIFETILGQYGTDFRTVCVLFFFFLCVIAKI